MNRKFFYFYCCFVVLFMVGCSDPVMVEQPRIDIIPQPLEIESKSGVFLIDKSTNITANGSNDAVDKLVANFNANLWENAGFKLLFNPNSEFTKNNIHLEVDPEFESDSSEGYSLQIDENGVLIKAKEIGGIFSDSNPFDSYG